MKKQLIFFIVSILFLSCDNATKSDIAGCTDTLACNYNSEANNDDGSCDFALENFDCNGDCVVVLDACGMCGGSIENEQDCIGYGCMDETACNYDETAITDNNSCIYSEEYYDCSGNCLSDDDDDGLCNELEVELPYDVGETLMPEHIDMSLSICYGSDDPSLKLSDFSGKVILLNLSASW